MDLERYLKPGIYIDSDHETVINYAINYSNGIPNKKEKIIALYYAIRDQFRYDPNKLMLTKDAIKASHLLTRDYGNCIEKACLFAASARVIGVPSRLGFANVCNHIGTSKLEEKLGTNVLVFHGFAEVLLDNKWIKATPAFNKTLCDKLNVEPLDFNADEDAVFQQFDKSGGQFMEYLHDYGTYDDVPFEKFIGELVKHYPHLKEHILSQQLIVVD